MYLAKGVCMNIPLFQVDAFTEEKYKGNPAAVCILNKWVKDEQLQKIARENNLSETAFIVKKNDKFELRWFTPTSEIDLCGHATLAAAYVVFNHIESKLNRVKFYTKSGELVVKKRNSLLTMDFPARPAKYCNYPERLNEAINIKPEEVLKARDYLLIYDNEKQIKKINPDFNKLKKLDTVGIIVSSRGEKYDFVSRFFAPSIGVNEDPVTGSSHTTLIPYWAKRLKKSDMIAYQYSKRGGTLYCENHKNRVSIAGNAVIYLKGNIFI